MPPKPKKQQPKVQEKKQTDKNQKGKEQPKKDGKGSIEKTTKDNKSPEPKGAPAKDEKKGAKGDKNDKKDAKDAKDTKGADKKDAKDQKPLDKKDANSKSISKLDKSVVEQKPKKQGKKDGKKDAVNRHSEKVENTNAAVINKMDEAPEPVERIKGDDYLIKDTGLLEAYEQFLRTICKYGLPTGDIYEFAAQQMEKYERKKKARQLKMKAQMEIRKAASKRPPKEEARDEYEN